VICDPCAHAADRQLGRDAHCDAQPGPGSQCDCQHRTDRYRPAATPERASVVIHVHPDPPHVVEAIRDIRRHGRG
jgi:hypothetical protein